MEQEIAAFERHLLRRYPTSSTPKHYVSDLRLFFRFMNKPPAEVTTEDVERFVEDQLAQGHSKATVNRRLSALSTFFHFWADERGQPNRPNPVRPRRHRVKMGVHLPRDASDEEVGRLFEVIERPRDRAMFTLMLRAGLRVGEVATLTLGDIALPIEPQQCACLRVHGKGDKERIAWLVPEAMAELWAWLERRPQVKHAYVFLNRRGRRITVAGIQHLLRTYCDQAGVEITCHRLRHTLGRQLAEEEMPVPSISKLFGHAQVSTTQGYIAGAEPEVRGEYEAAMSHILGRSALSVGSEESALLPERSLSSHPVSRGRVTEPTSASPQPEDFGEFSRAAWPEGSVEPANVDLAPYVAAFPTWLGEPLLEYLQGRQRRAKPSQRRRHVQTLASKLGGAWRWLLEHCALTSFEQLQREDVQAWVDARAAEGLAPRTLNRLQAALYSFLRYLEDRGERIAPSVYRIPRRKAPQPLPQALSEEESVRLEQAVLMATASGDTQDLLDQAWYYLLAHGGLRLGELVDLHLSDCDLAQRRLRIRGGKGDRDRIIYLSEPAAQALRAYLAVRAAASDHLLMQRGRPLGRATVRYRLKRYGWLAGLDVHPHRLRHTLATQLINAGVRITTIQKLLGHENLATTMIYAQVYDATVEREYREAMTRILARQPGLHRAPISMLDWPHPASVQSVVSATTQAGNSV